MVVLSSTTNTIISCTSFHLFAKRGLLLSLSSNCLSAATSEDVASTKAPQCESEISPLHMQYLVSWRLTGVFHGVLVLCHVWKSLGTKLFFLLFAHSASVFPSTCVPTSFPILFPFLLCFCYLSFPVFFRLSPFVFHLFQVSFIFFFNFLIFSFEPLVLFILSRFVSLFFNLPFRLPCFYLVFFFFPPFSRFLLSQCFFHFSFPFLLFISLITLFPNPFYSIFFCISVYFLPHYLLLLLFTFFFPLFPSIYSFPVLFLNFP